MELVATIRYLVSRLYLMPITGNMLITQLHQYRDQVNPPLLQLDLGEETLLQLALNLSRPEWYTLTRSLHLPFSQRRKLYYNLCLSIEIEQVVHALEPIWPVTVPSAPSLYHRHLSPRHRVVIGRLAKHAADGHRTHNLNSHRILLGNYLRYWRIQPYHLIEYITPETAEEILHALEVASGRHSTEMHYFGWFLCCSEPLLLPPLDVSLGQGVYLREHDPEKNIYWVGWWRDKTDMLQGTLEDCAPVVTDDIPKRPKSARSILLA